MERMHAPERVKCEACGETAAVRVPCVPAVQTSDLPDQMRKTAAAQGMPIETRDDLRRLERKGVGFLSDRDIDVMTRGERPHKRMVREIVNRIFDRERIVVR